MSKLKVLTNEDLSKISDDFGEILEREVSKTISTKELEDLDLDIVLNYENEQLDVDVDVGVLFDELSQMVSGNIISKTRYIIPYNGFKIELDIFHDKFEGLKYAEVEFPDIEGAKSFIAPDYFGEEVTEDASYQNSSLSRMSPDEISLFLKNNK